MATIKKSVVEKQQKENAKSVIGTTITCLHCRSIKPSSDCYRVKTIICHKDYGLCNNCGDEIVDEQEFDGIKQICELLNLPVWKNHYDVSKERKESTFESYVKLFYVGTNATKRYSDSDMFKEKIEELIKGKKKKKFKKLEIEDLDLSECWRRWGTETEEKDFVALETEFIKLGGPDAIAEDDVREIIGLAKTQVMMDELWRERDTRGYNEARKVYNAQEKLRQERIKERGDNSLTSLGVAIKLLEHDRPINLQPGKYTDEFAIKYFKRFIVHHLQVMLNQKKRSDVELLEGEDPELFEMEKDLI